MLFLVHSILKNLMKGFLDREEAIMRSSNPGKMEKILPATAQDAIAEPV
jgi:hypothetical protein